MWSEGARVAVHYRTSKPAAERLAAEVKGVAIGADLRVEKEADDLIPRALEALGRVDVVVANAGVWPPADEPIWELPLDRWQATLDANLTATFLTARGFLRHAADTGRRINPGQRGRSRMDRDPHDLGSTPEPGARGKSHFDDGAQETGFP